MGLGELLAGRLTPAARPVKTYELPVEVEVIRMDGKVVKLEFGCMPEAALASAKAD